MTTPKIFIFLIAFLFVGCFDYEVDSQIIALNGTVINVHSGDPISDVKVILEIHEAWDKPLYFDTTPEDGPISYDTTFSDNLGNFVFELPFEERPPWLFGINLIKEDFVGLSRGLSSFDQFQQETIRKMGLKTTLTLAGLFEKANRASFDAFGYSNVDNVKLDFRGNPVDYTEWTGVGLDITRDRNRISVDFYYDKYQYVLLRTFFFQDQELLGQQFDTIKMTQLGESIHAIKF